jgi:hypothetical protein
MNTDACAAAAAAFVLKYPGFNPDWVFVALLEASYSLTSVCHSE